MMMALATAAVLRPSDETTMTKELASSGKLRVGVVAAPAMSAFFVTRDAAGQPRRIEFIDMPESLRAKYQYFTEARMDRLRSAGYDRPFTSLEEGISKYVRHYLAADDPFH